MCVHFGTKLGTGILLEHIPKHLLSTLNEHPKVRPTRRFMKATRVETLLFNFRIWSLNVRLLSRVISISAREGILLGGREKFALKITICPKNKQFALKLTF